MSVEIKKEIPLEIAHVLFMDIVGYSKLLINDQRALLDALNQIVRSTDEFRSAEAAGRLIKIPTGDGMALVFYNNPEAPVECALDISRALKTLPNLPLRMGVHSGPVSEVIDVNRKANVTGDGINMAQRVMDCGDAGHILVSKRVAGDLEQYERWRHLLHKLAPCEVKHGVRVEIANLYSDEVGNRELPKMFQHRSRVRWAAVAIALIVLAVVAVAFLYVFRKPGSPPARTPLGGLENSTRITITFTYPRDKSLVDSSLTIEGTVSDPTAEVWMLVVTPQFDYWVQNSAPVESDGTWRLAVQVGKTTVGPGQTFQLLAVANPRVRLSRGLVLLSMPPADSAASIFVTRR